MSQVSQPPLIHDKRSSRQNNRGRFSWVRRLVQGQNSQAPEHHNQRVQRVSTQPVRNAVNPREADFERPPEVKFEVNRHNNGSGTPGLISDDNSTRKSLKSMDIASDEGSQMSVHSDNISTIPLKSIVSHTSTAPPSIISSEHHNDNNSAVASTAETSLLPSPHASVSPSYYTGSMTTRVGAERERDSESIVTLASSSRRVRRRSIDTNTSMAGIAPASIMERLNPSTRDPPGDETHSIGR